MKAPHTGPVQHVHIDVVGGIAGDMFIAAMLSMRDDLTPLIDETISAAGLKEIVNLEIVPGVDHHIAGLRFNVFEGANNTDHRSHADIQSHITHCQLSESIKERSLDIFLLLANAEAEVHDCRVEDVKFHELGAWDSIADIVIAAALIDGLGPANWSISSLPLGHGLVETQHGFLPVPAPATSLLLSGFACHMDGQPGERITPTGAALLKHLAPLSCMSSTGILHASGIGLGTRPGEKNANMLRMMLFKPTALESYDQDAVVACRFEIDDQSPESLAISLDCLRACDGVIDVCQFLGVGKKGRTTAQIQVLGYPTHEDAVVSACLLQTTTLGVRVSHEMRKVVARESSTIEINGTRIGIKEANRPGGIRTRKAEANDVQHGHDLATREAIRIRAEYGDNN
jgi:pyridinium-3,5-bisthiocarboxylic acid mononucleotide nickel chelatase